MKLQLFLAIAIVVSVSVPTLGDIAPPAGYKRIVLRLTVEPAEEVADYRFFIKSGADVEELILKKGEKTSVGPLGGGARYSSGVLLAVPRKAIDHLSDTPRDGAMSDLKQAVYGGLAGTIELVEHGFVREVNEKEAPGWKDPVFRIEKDAEKGLKAIWVSGGVNESKTHDPAAGSYYSTDPKSGGFWAAVIGASLFTLAAVLIVGFVVRRMRARGERTV